MYAVRHARDSYENGIAMTRARTVKVSIGSDLKYNSFRSDVLLSCLTCNRETNFYDIESIDNESTIPTSFFQQLAYILCTATMAVII